MKLNIKAADIKVGDKLNRFGHFHPVLEVEETTHPVVNGKVVRVTHDRGSLSFAPAHSVEVERTSFDAAEVARRFCDVLGEWLNAEQMEIVRSRNAAYAARNDYGVCASHDFCDANMAMLAAFNRTAGKPDEAEDFDLQDDGFQSVWNAAWSLAKRAEFVKSNISAVQEAA